MSIEISSLNFANFHFNYNRSIFLVLRFNGSAICRLDKFSVSFIEVHLALPTERTERSVVIQLDPSFGKLRTPS